MNRKSYARWFIDNVDFNCDKCRMFDSGINCKNNNKSACVQVRKYLNKLIANDLKESIENRDKKKIYRIYTETTEHISDESYDEDGYRDDYNDYYEVHQITIKYVDSYEKLSNFIDNCHIKEDLGYEEIEVE